MSEMRKLMEAVAPLFEYEADPADVAEELQGVLYDLEDLSQRAKALLESYFPEQYQQAEAYGALDFGKSNNKYDVTFEGIVSEILNSLDQE